MYNLSIYNQICSKSNPLQNEFELIQLSKTKSEKIKIYESITNKYNSVDLATFALWQDMQKDYKWSKFILNILIHKIDKLDRSGLNKGFFWKITNPETNVSHRLIGTTHAASKGMAGCSLLNETLKETEQLFTEFEYRQDLTDEYSFKTVFYKDPARYIIDEELIKEAFKRGIPIQRLDFRAEFESELNFSVEKCIKQLAEQRELKNLGIYHYSPTIYGDILEIARLYIPIFEAWHKGDIDAKIFANTSNEDYQRNGHWLKYSKIKDISGHSYTGLLDLISKTKHSSCIAVGLAHCLGHEDNSLLRAFKEKGYLIEKLEPKAKIHSRIHICPPPCCMPPPVNYNSTSDQGKI